MAKILEPSQKISEKDLQEVEKRIGKAIPLEYREFLPKKNGGYPEPCDFEIEQEDGSKEQISLNYFFAVNTESNNLETMLKIYKDRVPPDLFLIANDPGGNLICPGIKIQVL